MALDFEFTGQEAAGQPRNDLIWQTRRLVGDTEYISGTGYVFEDSDYAYYLEDAVYEVEMDYEQGYTVPSGINPNDSEGIIPDPDKVSERLFATKAAILMKGKLEEEGLRDGIYVKDGDTAIDTTRTINSRGKSLESLRNDYDRKITQLVINDQEGGFTRTANFPEASDIE